MIYLWLLCSENHVSLLIPVTVGVSERVSLLETVKRPSLRLVGFNNARFWFDIEVEVTHVRLAPLISVIGAHFQHNATFCEGEKHSFQGD